MHRVHNMHIDSRLPRALCCQAGCGNAASRWSWGAPAHPKLSLPPGHCSSICSPNKSPLKVTSMMKWATLNKRHHSNPQAKWRSLLSGPCHVESILSFLSYQGGWWASERKRSLTKIGWHTAISHSQISIFLPWRKQCFSWLRECDAMPFLWWVLAPCCPWLSQCGCLLWRELYTWNKHNVVNQLYSSKIKVKKIIKY